MEAPEEQQSQMDTFAGDSAFADMEFPDIDLNNALDMGGETAETLPQEEKEEEPGFYSTDFPGMEDIPGGDEPSLDLPGAETDGFGMGLADGDDLSASDFGTGDIDTNDFGADADFGSFETENIDAGFESSIDPEPMEIGPLEDVGLADDTEQNIGTDGSIDFGSGDISSGFDSASEGFPEPLELNDIEGTGEAGADSKR